MAHFPPISGQELAIGNDATRECSIASIKVTMPAISDRICSLQTLLTKYLKSTGEDGFEGLMANVLCKITGFPFRLAASGRQSGSDGSSAAGDRHISFECKLYSEKVGEPAVMAKIGELAVHPNPPDIWVLCATSPISQQIADKVKRFDDASAVSTLILDWPDTQFPRLATAFAMAREVVTKFIKKDDSAIATDARHALNTIAKAPEFASQADDIRCILTSPEVGLESARIACNRWLEEAFSDRDLAMDRFGQPLSPADHSNGNIYDRSDFIRAIGDVFTGYSTSILCITGDEGVGKSWIAAQSWLRETSRPIVLMISPNVFPRTADELDTESKLITALITQTEEQPSDRHRLKVKWRKIFGTWRRKSAAATRFVVVIDGINQRPENDWGRILDKFVRLLHEIGGQLIVTVRKSYYQHRLDRRLACPHHEIEIPEWTEEERDTILKDQKITAAHLAPKLISTLRNPRILGIAIKMWDRTDIFNLADLSVSRLLFEHIRTSELDAPLPQPPHEIVRIIRNHAEKVLSRIQHCENDLTVFEKGKIEDVVEGRFFRTIEDDDSRYELTEDGLPLALAFLAIDRMRGATRNKRSPSEGLKAIVEPIASLDMTSDVLMAAMTVACIDDSSEYPDQMVIAIIEELVGLQNLSDDCYSQLVNLATRRTLAFSTAAYNMCLCGGRQANFDLITRALRTVVRKNDDSWRIVRDYVMSWLNHYSIDSEHEGHEKRLNFKERSEELSISERQVFGDLAEVEGDMRVLHGLGFSLLASRPRAPAARMLVRCTFGKVLATGYHHFDQLEHLIRFNTLDWLETRLALLREVEIFERDDVSENGKWTLVQILRATGHIEDALRAGKLAHKLGAYKGRTWRLVEDICASDPCDPKALRPDDFAAPQCYEAMSFDNHDDVRLPRDDVVFKLARPAMARFDGERAAAKHREYADAVISIADRDHKVLHELRSHNALLDPSHVRSLQNGIEVGTSTTHKEDEDRWFSGQLRLVLTLPFLDSSDQVDALIKAGTEPMLDLIDNLHKMDGDVFGDRLKEACRTKDENAQFALSVIGSSTETLIRSDTTGVVGRLLESASERVRAQMMGMVARLDNVDLLRKVAIGSKWQASRRRHDDDCYGSMVLLSSVQKQLVSHVDALRRMSPCYYGLAAMKWKPEEAIDVARHIDFSIRKALELKADFDRQIEVDMEHRGGLRCSPWFSDDAIFEWNEKGILRLSVDNEEIDRRLKILQEEFESLEREIRRAESYVILDCLDLDEFRAIADSDYDLSDSWYELFINMPDSQLRVLYSLVLALGYSLGYRCADKAVALFSRVKRCKPMVSVWYGKARVSIDALSIWGGADAEKLDSLRCCRLDEASNDYRISQEVLAAHLKGKERLIQRYIETKLNREEPAEKARALMVAGFSDRSEFNDSVLDQYRNAEGFVGEVSSAAIYAYERNTWARHWYSIMCRAEGPIEFWRMSVLFLKVVDGRYDLWCSDSEYEDRNEPMKRFFPNLRYALKRRMNKWKSRRERKLFGGSLPKEWFVSARGILPSTVAGGGER